MFQQIFSFGRTLFEMAKKPGTGPSWSVQRCTERIEQAIVTGALLMPAALVNPSITKYHVCCFPVLIRPSLAEKGSSNLVKRVNEQLLGTIHKGCPQNSRDFYPLPPCTHFGKI